MWIRATVRDVLGELFIDFARGDELVHAFRSTQESVSSEETSYTVVDSADLYIFCSVNSLLLNNMKDSRLRLVSADRVAEYQVKPWAVHDPKELETTSIRPTFPTA